MPTSKKSPARTKMPSSMRVSSRKSSSNKPFLIVVLAIVALGIAGILALAISGSSTASAGVQETRDVTVTGQALSDAAQGTGVGEVMPRIEGASFDGTPVVIDPADGRTKLIVLAAHWCPHCQKEIPELSKYFASNDLPANTDMYLISTSASASRPNWPASEWLANNPLPAKIIADSQANQAAQALGLSGFPMFVVVDGSGKVTARFSGEVPSEQVAKLVANTAAGRPASQGL